MFAAFTCSNNWQTLRFRSRIISFVVVSTSSLRRERRSEMQMQIALFPCVRVMAHYAHVGSTTKESGGCSAFMHAPRARIAHNEELQDPFHSRVSQKEPPTLAFRSSPWFMRADSNPDFSYAHSRLAIERFVLVHYNTQLLKNVIKLALHVTSNIRRWWALQCTNDWWK